MANVLIVEPDRKLADTYVEALQFRDHLPVVSLSAQQGILAADRQTPDMVLLELQMPAHSGIEFLYEFRSYADWRAVPVVVFTNVPPQTFAASEKTLRSLGVQAYLYKPQTSLKTLVETIEGITQTAWGQ